MRAPYAYRQVVHRGAVTMAVICAMLMGGAWGAWAAHPLAEADADYDVVYQVNGVTYTAKSVKVLDIVTVGSREFLVIERHALNQKVQGHIALNSVVSILPQGMVVKQTESTTSTAASSSTTAEPRVTPLR